MPNTLPKITTISKRQENVIHMKTEIKAIIEKSEEVVNSHFKYKQVFKGQHEQNGRMKDAKKD